MAEVVDAMTPLDQRVPAMWGIFFSAKAQVHRSCHASQRLAVQLSAVAWVAAAFVMLSILVLMLSDAERGADAQVHKKESKCIKHQIEYSPP
mmetsp:Transcript_108301/g.191838  ORF Transcript_108301/g.191838 Transcript_108301/m.191838 type:complete len:92 (-) Transcript_108301:6-281(-)